MRVSDFDIDLVSYMALSEVFNSEQDVTVKEDVRSKMNVHSKKLKGTNSLFSIRS